MPATHHIGLQQWRIAAPTVYRMFIVSFSFRKLFFAADTNRS